jgi:flagellar biosynthetic protein FliP
MTPFARLLIVFHFLRQALGLQTTPSNQTLIGLSLIMTFFLMQPVATQIYSDAVMPMQAGEISGLDAITRAEVPMRQFMAHYVREKDVALFIELAKEPRPATMDDVSMRVLLPAYILSELKAGFQIGTVLFLPFLIVDMVVASITTSVGMLQLPPVVISTPLKLLLFLMVDGWHLLIGSLDEELPLAMGVDQVVLLGRMMLQEVMILVGPILAVAIFVSLTVNIIQVLTSLQDNTVSTVSRLLATGAPSSS